MDKANYAEDFRYVVDTIRSVHPLAISALPDNFNEYGNKFVDNINDKYELIANLSRLTACSNCRGTYRSKALFLW